MQLFEPFLDRPTRKTDAVKQTVYEAAEWIIFVKAYGSQRSRESAQYGIQERPFESWEGEAGIVKRWQYRGPSEQG